MTAPVQSPAPNWVEFFHVLTMHRQGVAFTRSYEDVVLRDVEGTFAPRAAKALDMVPLPDGHPNGLTAQAIEWLQERAGA